MPSRDFPSASFLRSIDAHTHVETDPARVIALRSFRLEEVGTLPWENARFRSAGLHPWFVESSTLERDLDLLADVAHRRGLVALGETGLDRLRGPDLAHQVRAFEGHIALSESMGLPLVVHCVRSGSDLLQIRKRSGARRPWLLHGWNGSSAQTSQLLDVGCVPSFGAALLRPDSPTRRLVAKLPAGTFLLETDDAPVDIALVEAEAAALRETDSVTLRGQLHRAWISVFGETATG